MGDNFTEQTTRKIVGKWWKNGGVVVVLWWSTVVVQKGCSGEFCDDRSVLPERTRPDLQDGGRKYFWPEYFPVAGGRRWRWSAVWEKRERVKSVYVCLFVCVI